MDIIGTPNNDVLTGTGGDDNITGLAGDDVVKGEDGNDTLDGGSGNDRLEGGAGNDILNGGTGSDTMIGGLGDDHYLVDVVGDQIIEADGEGTDQVQASFSYTLGANLENLRGLGTFGPLTLVGNGLNNIIMGTGFGHDVLAGEAGNDYLDGNGGQDSLSGGAGDDIFVVRHGSESVSEIANNGTDEVLVMVTTYILPTNVEKGTATGVSQIFLTGNTLDNVLKGTAGWDTINGGAGADVMIGFAGNDWYIVDNVGDQIVEVDAASGGSDTVETSLGSYTLQAGLELVVGNASTQTLTGNDGDNWLTSNGGGDTLTGGKGNDLYQISAGDILVELAGEGVDLVRTSATFYVLPEHFEELQATSFSNAQTLIGNAADNRIIGTLLNNQSDTIDGGLGADQMIGWHGSDIYYVDNAGDTIVEESHHGTADEIRTTISFTASANVENVTALSDGGLTLTGNALANTIRGGAGSDVLVGEGGADQLIGGLGGDIYRIDAADTIVEAAGGGFDTVEAGFSYTLGAELDALTLTGTASIDATGNALDNRLTGNSGDNRFQGGAGNDTIIGGAGSDTAIFSGLRSDYLIDTSNGVSIRDLNLADGDDGTDTTDGVELLQFADMIVSMGIDPNNAPQLGQPAMEDQVWPDGVADSYQIPGTAFIELDANDELTYQAELADGHPLPSWLSFDPATRTFSGTPPVSDIGITLEIKVTASDGQVAISDNLLFTVTQAPGADIHGTGGPDVLDGTFRDETMFADWGDDILRGSAGADRLDGNAGFDEVDYSLSPEGVTIDLVNNIGHGGHAEGDIYIAIERFTGSTYGDHIISGDNWNTLSGGDGDDLIEAGGGSDLLIGGEGADTLLGGDGKDIVLARANADGSLEDLVDGGTDRDLLDLSESLFGAIVNLSDPAGGVTGIEDVTGTAENDQLTGDGAANELRGEAGDDILSAGGGQDKLYGGIGTDLLSGGAETDYLYGEAGNDSLFGGSGSDLLDGGEGNDFLDGGADADTLEGRGGDDIFVVTEGDTVALSNTPDGTDEVRTALAAYTLGISLENLTGLSSLGQALTGNASVNVIIGGWGGDLIDGGAGADDMRGSLGNDVYLVDDAGDLVTEGDTQGLDEVRTNLATYSLAGVGHVENLTGGAGDQSLTGNGHNNVIDGGLGADTMAGGGGHDTYIVDTEGDSVIELAGAGTDEIRTTLASYSLASAANVENLTGGAGDQTLTGNSGSNRIDGGAGADAMTGGLGNDVYVVDNLGDTVTELAGEGIDEIRTNLGSKAPPERAVYVLPDFIENLTGTSAFAQGVRDNALDNVIVMGNGHDLVVADAGGVDTVSGGVGNDFFYYGDKLTAADTTNGGANIDTIALLGDYASGLTFTAANLVGVERMALYTSLYQPGTGPNNYAITMNDANVAAGTEFFVTAASLQSNESLTFNGAAETDGRFTVHGGGGADTITGGAGGDFVLGNGGNDMLYGLGGLDFLVGGLGADQLRGGSGGDRFVYQSTAQSMAGSVDHILDFNHADRIDLSTIDANGNAADGNSAFTFIGANAFGNVAGELRASQSGGVWFVEGDTNGDGLADLVIQVTLPDATPLGAGDFIL